MSQASLHTAARVERGRRAGAYLEHLNAVRIVNELDLGPVDALFVVLGQFQLEEEGGEELLQLLVGVVDAQLLERVDL